MIYNQKAENRVILSFLSKYRYLRELPKTCWNFFCHIIRFTKHLSNISKKINKTLGLLRNILSILPKSSLLIIIRWFERRLSDYGDIIYDESYNASFHQRIKSLQRSIALATTAVFRNLFREKLYQKFVLKFLQQKCCYPKLFCILKSIESGSTLTSIISS